MTKDEALWTWVHWAAQSWLVGLGFTKHDLALQIIGTWTPGIWWSLEGRND